ncbi:oxidoreductase family protein [Actinoplanes italicus]|uniref:Oxidoreductase family protein n=1 Tax=Actinoplanes italicus TaxID=113567 RepID=A0A2T0K8C7_9ACTN|nr:oxidoreductase family protein [Actinoplanes italicus]
MPLSREVRVAAVPAGLPRPTDLTVTETPVPDPGPGQVLVRNRWFTVFAALRTLLAGVTGAPFPGLGPGDTLFGPAIGEVVSAPDGDLKPGEFVQHMLGWREYALVAAADCRPLGTDLPDPAVHLSQGVTAYGALTRAAPVRPGDTVLVTGGAGAVGSIAGRIARLLGAVRDRHLSADPQADHDDRIQRARRREDPRRVGGLATLRAGRVPARHRGRYRPGAAGVARCPHRTVPGRRAGVRPLATRETPWRTARSASLDRRSAEAAPAAGSRTAGSGRTGATRHLPRGVASLTHRRSRIPAGAGSAVRPGRATRR